MLLLYHAAFFQVLLPILVSCKCRIVLNELNADIANKEDSEFIELAATNCNGKRPSLRDFVILVIREFDKVEQAPVIVFSADLYIRFSHQIKISL